MAEWAIQTHIGQAKSSDQHATHSRHCFIDSLFRTFAFERKMEIRHDEYQRIQKSTRFENERTYK